MPKYSYQRAVPGMYGDGSDDNLTFDGSSTILGMAPSSSVYTLTKNVYAIKITINSGVTIKTMGFILHASDILNNAGTISSNGNDASGGTAGTIIIATGILQCVGAAGGAGISATGAGNTGTGSGGRNITGSSSGNGGRGDPGNLGGNGNNSAAPTASQGTIRNLANVLRARLYDNTSMNGSGGGGGGGCQLASGTATSGGGGGGAIPQIIMARRLNNTGSITANGGKGGNATTTADASAGGGGGGGAGVNVICTEELISKGTIQANGGTGGSRSGGNSTNGSNGTNGFSLIFLPTTTLIL